jgi:hypothetical protein
MFNERGKGGEILSVFTATICQAILFGAVFLLDIVFVPWPSDLWILLIFRDGLPVLVSILCCFIVHRNAFHFRFKNLTCKGSILRIVSRMIAVLFVLIIGYMVDISNRISSGRLGKYGDMMLSMVRNFNFYICVSLFLFVFALVEYIFVAYPNRQAQT